MTVRSQSLLQYTTTAAGYTPFFYCPAGHVVLLKAIHITNGAVVNTKAQAIVQNAALTVGVFLFDQSLATVQAIYLWEGWIVLNPGDRFGLYADQAGVTMWASGAVLDGPNQFPPAARVDSPLAVPDPAVPTELITLASASA